MKPFRAILGSTIIILGIIFLMENLGYFNFPWIFFWQLWPLLLVIWGLSYLVKSSVHFVISLIGILLLVGAGIAYSIDSGKLNGWNWHGERVGAKQELNLAYQDSIDAASLKILGGAGVYNIGGTTSNLIDLKAESTVSKFKLSGDESNKNITVSQDNFTMFGFQKEKNNLDLSLNAKPEWTIEMQCGAISSTVDLSAQKIKKFVLNSGATSIDLKLGDIADLTNVEIKTGASSIVMKIPKEVGSKVISKTGLSDKQYEGFELLPNGNYQTSNYEISLKKINFDISAGVSSIKIERY